MPKATFTILRRRASPLTSLNVFIRGFFCLVTVATGVARGEQSDRSYWLKETTAIRKGFPSVYKQYLPLWNEANRRWERFFEHDERPDIWASPKKIERLKTGDYLIHFHEANGPRSWRLYWNDKDCPPPLFRGSEVKVALDAKGEICSFTSTADGYAAARIRSDGMMELLLVHDFSGESPKPKGAKPQYILVVPTGTDFSSKLFLEIRWRRGLGVWVNGHYITAGDEGEEVEDPPSWKKLGLPIDNVPDKRIQIGRDGWVTFDKVPVTKATGGYEDYIPRNQYGAGSPSDADEVLKEWLNKRGWGLR